MADRDSVAKTTFEFAEKAREARSIAQLDSAFGDAIKEWGFTSWVCARISANTDGIRKPMMRIFGQPNVAWTSHYHASRYVYDDVVTKELMVRDVAFFWSDVQNSHFMTPRARNIFGEAAEFGWERGASVPVRLFDGSVWGVSVAGERIERSGTILDALDTVGQFYTGRAAYIWVPDRPDHMPMSRLTDAQIAVVSRVARGMMYNQIAAECGISAKTVEKHLVKARERFGATTTAQLVAEALLSGDITVE